MNSDGVPKMSVIEWVFKGLAESGALESVWAYNQPVSHKDYMIDPSEGLWDEPGWERYVPAEKTGADGKSQGFLSNLYTLHANTGYLVKLKPGTSGTIHVQGKPVVGHHRWALDAYNVAGFPLPATGGATVKTMKDFSPITHIRGLTTDGNWTELADGAALQSGQSYLVYYGDPGADGRQNFTAPLDVLEVASDGLAFQAGYQGRRQVFELENLTNANVTVNLSLKNSSLIISQVTSTSGSEVLTRLPVDVTVNANRAESIVLQVDSADLPAAAEDVLEISSPGIRWLVPIAAKPGSYDGLWVGEVVVNNVSEARLGGTGESDLTIALDQRNASLTRGSAQMHEKAVGSTTSVDITVTLSLPLPTPAPVQSIQGTTPYVGGYVFLDENLNGQRDATERGLSGVTVTLGGSPDQTTAADGSYVFSGVGAGDHAISATVGDGYTASFDVILPDDVEPVSPVANFLPASVTVAADGIGGVAPRIAGYLAQVLPEPYTTLPYFDATGARVQPAINFGYAVAHTVKLRAGTCTSPGTSQRRDSDGHGHQWPATANRVPTTLTVLTGQQHHIVVERLSQVVACGDIVVGAPTKFADGGGSEFRFRLLLRVAEQRGCRTAAALRFRRDDRRARVPATEQPGIVHRRRSQRLGCICRRQRDKVLDRHYRAGPAQPLQA